MPTSHKAGSTNGDPSIDARAPLEGSKSLRVDAVVDLLDTIAGHPDSLMQVAPQLTGQRHVVVHERPVRAAHQPVLEAAPIGVAGVPAVFAVDAHGDTRPRSRQRHLERAEVARMHQRRPHLTQQAHQARRDAKALARRLVQRVNLHVIALHAPEKIAVNLGQRDHRMAEPISRQAVDQVDDTVLQPADVEPMQHMRHQRPLILDRHRAAPLTQGSGRASARSS